MLPTDFPVAFIDIVRRCLSRNPAQRPSVADFQDWLKRGTAEPDAATPPPAPSQATATAAAVVAKPSANDGSTRLVIRAVLSSEPEPEPAAERKSFVVPIVAVVVAVALGWVGVHWYMGRSNSEVPATEVASTTAPEGAAAPGETAGDSARGSGAAASDAANSPATPGAAAATSSSSRTAAASATTPSAASGPVTPPVAAPPGRTSARSASSGSDVLHEEIPNVPLHSRETIHGHVKVIVRVTVDPSGTVVSDVLENPGPSKYFARLAGQAASKWKFAPADHQATRQWLVRFEFSRDGTKAQAVTRN